MGFGALLYTTFVPAEFNGPAGKGALARIVPRPAAAVFEAYLTSRMARKASWGMSTLPTRRIRFLPVFCFSSTFILRV